LKALIEEHLRRTGSPRAADLLARWRDAVHHFRQIVPVAPPPPAVSDAARDSSEDAIPKAEKKPAA
jgi:glutamate synthase domain-containing protein 3